MISKKRARAAVLVAERARYMVQKGDGIHRLRAAINAYDQVVKEKA